MTFDYEKHTIYKIRHGSHAYGCNIETSDEDFKGWLVAPIEYYLGFSEFEQLEKSANKGDPYDEVIYDVRKFIGLAKTQNPNILEMLFVDQRDIIVCSPIAEMLLKQRDEFVTQGAYKSFSSYAFAQMRRLRSHRNWLLYPPTKKPEREDFDLSKTSKISQSEMGAYDALPQSEIPINVMELLVKEKKYAAAKRNWDQYQNWKQTRNVKRAADEARWGYDCKHAYHLVRLYRMGREILEGKGVIVRRPDREELIAIRSGAWSYDQLDEWFTKQEEELKVVLENSKIKKEIDEPKLNKLCVDIISQFHGIKL